MELNLDSPSANSKQQTANNSWSRPKEAQRSEIRLQRRFYVPLPTWRMRETPKTLHPPHETSSIRSAHSQQTRPKNLCYPSKCPAEIQHPTSRPRSPKSFVLQKSRCTTSSEIPSATRLVHGSPHHLPFTNYRTTAPAPAGSDFKRYIQCTTSSRRRSSFRAPGEMPADSRR
jgi:hypothetical protein